MSSSGLEIDPPQLCASQLVAHPGSLPTITVPVSGAVPVDVDGITRYLGEAAEFFGIPMPGTAELAAAISESTARIGTDAGRVAANVTIAVMDGVPQILVTGVPIRPAPLEAVRISVDDSVPHAHRVTDPWWRRMAARTTSRGDVDQLERWLNDRFLADCVSDGMPHLGAVVFEVAGGGFVGIENPEPTSILDLLERCGGIEVTDRVSALPRDVDRAWWISPRYEVHPVAQFGGTEFAPVAAVPLQFSRSA